MYLILNLGSIKEFPAFPTGDCRFAVRTFTAQNQSQPLTLLTTTSPQM